MLRSIVYRPCLQRLQQCRPRSFSAGRAQLLPESERSPGSDGRVWRVWSNATGFSTDTRGEGRTSLSRQKREPEDWRQKVARQTTDPWGQELALAEIYRKRQFPSIRGYLRSSPPNVKKTATMSWRKWKVYYPKLFEYMAGGDVSSPPWIWDREAVEREIEQWRSRNQKPNLERLFLLMLSAMWVCPGRVVDILDITHAKRVAVPGYLISDVVHFAAKWQNLQPLKLKTHATRLCDVTIAAFSECSYGPTRLRQNTIYNLSRSADAGSVATLYKFLRAKKHRLHAYSLLSKASTLARDPKHKQLALEIAIQANVDGVDLNERHWASLCTKILTLTPEGAKTSDDFSVEDAFTTLLDHGFAPNMVFYTALIRNLCLTGKVRTAWVVFEGMKQHGIEPDSILLSTLLDGAKRGLSASIINKVAEEIVERKAIDVVALNTMLFSVLHFYEEESKTTRLQSRGITSIPAFEPMLFLYSRVFKMGPLQTLIPMDLAPYSEAEHPRMPADWPLTLRLSPMLEMMSLAVTDKLAPTGATLSIMFIAYVKSLSQPMQLISLYAYIRQQVMQGNTVASIHVREKGTIIYDIIIKALCEHSTMLRPALDIVSDMLKHTLEERARSQAEPAAAKKRGEANVQAPQPPQTPNLHPAPSVYTWNILLHGLLAHKEMTSAKQVQKMMVQHGIEPNQVTWNTLVGGYARNQNVDWTVRALRGLEASGYEPDEYTLGGFARLVNKELAFAKMQATIDLETKKLEAERMAKIKSAIDPVTEYATM